MQLAYTDTVTVLGYCITVISLSMYVITACIFTLQGTLFQGRPGPFWAPHLHPYLCRALQVLFARDASAYPAPTYQPSSDTTSSHTAQLLPVTSACVSARPAYA